MFPVASSANVIIVAESSCSEWRCFLNMVNTSFVEFVVIQIHFQVNFFANDSIIGIDIPTVHSSAESTRRMYGIQQDIGGNIFIFVRCHASIFLILCYAKIIQNSDVAICVQSVVLLEMFFLSFPYPC